MAAISKPPIQPVLEHYHWDGRLGGRGPWYRVSCPFHGDRHASASLNEDEQVFVCHACDINGDAYAIVMQQEGVDFTEAQRRVQAITGASYAPVPGSTSRRLASSRLPAWTRDRGGSRKRLSSRGGRRDHS